MTYFLGAIITLLAICIGGFLSRAAYAIPRGEAGELWDPKCPFCGTSLGAVSLIPLVSFFLHRGKCPHCKEKISPRTLLSEIVFGAAALLLFIRYGFCLRFFSYLAVCALLLVLSLIDLDIREVPHSVLFGVLFFGVLYFALSFFSLPKDSLSWWEHLAGAFTISLPLFALMMFTGGGIGGGDVKLMFCIGLLLGYKLVIVAFLFGIVAAALTALFLVFRFGKSGRFLLPLVPFLSLGFLFAVTFGKYIENLLFFVSL